MSEKGPFGLEGMFGRFADIFAAIGAIATGAFFFKKAAGSSKQKKHEK